MSYPWPAPVGPGYARGSSLHTARYEKVMRVQQLSSRPGTKPELDCHSIDFTISAMGGAARNRVARSLERPAATLRMIVIASWS